MYDLLNKAGGRALLRVSGDMPQGFVNICCECGIEVFELRYVDDFCLELKVRAEDIKLAKSAAERNGFSISLIKKAGILRWKRQLALRAIPVILAIIFVAALFISKFFVWEIRVSGNKEVKTGEILDVLAENGVVCGAFWPDFSPDNIRSRVLYSIPELSWVTVNMNGSLAEVIVVEREEVPEMEYKGAASDIVAEMPGFVREITVLAGQSKIKSGSAVEKGDILISGIAESSYAPPRFLRAMGSVKAEINSAFTAVVPANKYTRREIKAAKRKFALIAGNKRINFYSDSSISDDFCDKIISVWKAELGKLFSLPISVVCISQRAYDTEKVALDSYEAEEYLTLALKRELSLKLPSAEILAEKLSLDTNGMLQSASLRVRCITEIGKRADISAGRMAQAENYSLKVDE